MICEDLAANSESDIEVVLSTVLSALGQLKWRLVNNLSTCDGALAQRTCSPWAAYGSASSFGAMLQLDVDKFYDADSFSRIPRFSGPLN